MNVLDFNGKDPSAYSKRRPSLKVAAKGIAVLLALLGLAAAWQWTPLNQWTNFETLAAWQNTFRNHPGAPYMVVAAYVLGAFVLFPVTLLTVVTVFTFGPILGNAYALVGWLLSGVVGYGVGRALGQDLLRDFAGSRLDCLQRERGRKGLVTVLVLRVLPIAPFMLVNLFIGASRVRLTDFILGSVIGRTPGLLALTVFGYNLESALRAPALDKFALVAALLLLLIAVAAWLSWMARQRQLQMVSLETASKKSLSD